VSAKLRVAVIGVGAFGRNHARVYSELQRQSEPVELAGIVDSDLSRAQSIAAQFGTQPYGSVKDLLADQKIDAATVAVPTIHHLSVARELMQAGVDVLVEKPVASTLAEADELIRLANSSGRVAMVGHLERFNPAVRATGPLISRPMFFEIHRLSIFTPRSLDVDVVLDLMIHDIDVVLSFVDSPVKEIRAVGLPILSGKVDIANVRMEFESGCVANFTASRVSTERVRKLRFFQPRQYISIDYTRQDVLVFSVDPSLVAQVKDSSLEALGTLIKPSKPTIEAEEPLRAELRSFLDAVRRRSKPVITLEDGRRALGVALDILAQIREHGRRVHLDAMWAQK
jgi:predicted dehydrogenase